MVNRVLNLLMLSGRQSIAGMMRAGMQRAFGLCLVSPEKAGHDDKILDMLLD
jgi:hypothetical protein